jgi:LCP family protein required for cell wall assembly
VGRHSHPADDRRARSAERLVTDARPVQGSRGRVGTEAVIGKRRKRRVWRGLALAVVILLALAGVASVWAWSFLSAVNQDMVRTDAKVLKALTPVAKSSPKPSAPPSPFTMLLLGTDNRGQAGDSRTDSIIFARVDPATKRVWLLSLPRDTKAEIPGYGVAKLNKAYALGGAALTIDTVEQLLGVPVNHYMEVNVNGFKRIVEVLGGVWVDVDVEIDDPKAAAANPGHEGQHIQAGYQKLTPAEALVYVRSRAFPDADFTRMRHQQTFFKAIAKQSTAFANVFKLPRLVREVSRFTQTDMSVNQLVGIARRLRGATDKSVDTATLAGEWRSPYIYTDEELKADLVRRMMAGRAFESTATAEAVPADVSVAVRNGSGVSGVATKAQSALVAEGYDVREVGNAKRSDYAKTLVIYQGDESAARAVAASLGQGEIVAGIGQYSFDADVLVVVGKDWKAVAPKQPALN